MKNSRWAAGFAGALFLLTLVFAPLPAFSQVCGDGDIAGGEECDPGGGLFVDGNPSLSTCTNGNDCFYANSCCKFNCQFVGQGAPCFDGDVCTSNDICDQVGQCIGDENSPNGTPCDDGLFCTGTETCLEGECAASTGDPCGGSECNTCQEDTDTCFDPATTPCTGEGGVCADGECDGSGTCVEVPNTAPCDDGLFCNGADTCAGGTCSVHAGDPCLEGGECADTCDEALDTCNLPVATACTDDENLCTDDVCDGVGSCTHPNNSAPCDDGLFCNGADVCSGGSCTSGVVDACDDDVSCTVDICNEDQDTCSNAADDSLCDDALFCNGTETCDATLDCQAGTDPCFDGNACTVDSCDEGGDSCLNDPLPELATCDDGSACTLDDICVGGACVGQAPLLEDLCPWTLVVKNDGKSDKLKTELEMDVDGDICGGRVFLGVGSINGSDVVSTDASGNPIRVSRDAFIAEDIVTAGGGVKGKPGVVVLPATADETRLAGGTVTAKTDASGEYHLDGTHPLVAPCEAARTSFDASSTLIENLASTAQLDEIRLRSGETLTISADVVGGLNVIDIPQIRTSRDNTIELDAQGDSDSVFVIRIEGKLQLRLRSVVSFLNGADPAKVLWYVDGRKCQLSDKTVGGGTLLCASGKIKVGDTVNWTGVLYAGRKLMKIGDRTTVSFAPFQGL